MQQPDREGGLTGICRKRHRSSTESAHRKAKELGWQTYGVV
jgi:hypothetical protein